MTASSGVNRMWEAYFAVDPLPWLMAQDELAAVRGRALLGQMREDDQQTVNLALSDLQTEQCPDGSFRHSPMRSATVLALLADLDMADDGPLASGAAEYLLTLLAQQPGYERARYVEPDDLLEPCDLCGFFGPYADRADPHVLRQGAEEMNAYRLLEPLSGPAKEVRWQARSSLDRVGPGSCYAWGFVPLAYIIEALAKAGYSDAPRLTPALRVLLGAQRQSGGWCRSRSGHARCTLHGLRALAAHSGCRQSTYLEHALQFVHAARKLPHIFAYLHVLATVDHPLARDIIREKLPSLASRQRRNGTFGTPCRTEKVVAVLLALRAVTTENHS